MGYHPRIEDPDKVNFLTTRTVQSRLWFVNNQRLESTVLGLAAKFTHRYGVELYALAIEGNHIQGPALFPQGNRASFMRDFNSGVARAVKLETSHGGGTVWDRRYSNEFLPAPEDVEEYFFYTVLQPVKDGLVDRISDYPGYNCFHDAIRGIERKFKIVRWAEYNTAVRRGRNPHVKDYTDIVILRYSRLPGYEQLSQDAYARLMQEKLEQRRVAIVESRRAQGLTCVGRATLIKTTPGSLPKSTKTSLRNSHRPRILSVCPKRRAEGKAWYFDIYFKYKDASLRYRRREVGVIFPLGTYPPASPRLENSALHLPQWHI